MVAICEFVIINYHPRRSLTRDIIIAAFFFGHGIHIGQKFDYRILDRVRAAESTNNTAFVERVFYLFAFVGSDLLFTNGHRPLGAVPPIGDFLKKLHGIEELSLDNLADIFPVGGGGRPVHQLVYLVGTLVKLVNAPAGGKISRRRYKGVGRDVLRQGNDNSHPRLFRCMPVSGVEDGSIFALAPETFDEPRFGIVVVQSKHGAALHILLAPPSVLKETSHKTASVLGFFLVGLAHLLILCHRLTGTDGGLEFRAKVSPIDRAVFPYFGITAFAVGDFHTYSPLNAPVPETDTI